MNNSGAFRNLYAFQAYLNEQIETVWTDIKGSLQAQTIELDSRELIRVLFIASIDGEKVETQIATHVAFRRTIQWLQRGGWKIGERLEIHFSVRRIGEGMAVVHSPHRLITVADLNEESEEEGERGMQLVLPERKRPRRDDA